MKLKKFRTFFLLANGERVNYLLLRARGYLNVFSTKTEKKTNGNGEDNAVTFIFSLFVIFLLQFFVGTLKII